MKLSSSEARELSNQTRSILQSGRLKRQEALRARFFFRTSLGAVVGRGPSRVTAAAYEASSSLIGMDRSDVRETASEAPEDHAILGAVVDSAVDDRYPVVPRFV